MLYLRFLLGMLSLCLGHHHCDAAPSSKEAKFSQTWQLGGDLSIHFASNTTFDFTYLERVQFSAHLPGFEQNNASHHNKELLQIQHLYSEFGRTQLIQKEGLIRIFSNWHQKFPADFIHLLYGAARKEWLKKRIFPVHAACIGNDREGYILLVGSPGSGKTSLTLNNVLHYDHKIFSGDKTLLHFTSDGTLEAIAGTHTITIRAEDIKRWSQVPKEDETFFGDRLAFQLPSSYYSDQLRVPIKKILFVGLNDGVKADSLLNPISALHQLFPFFLDKQREDILISGDQACFDGSVPKGIKVELAKNLLEALQTIPVYKVTGSLQSVTSFIQNLKENQEVEGISQKTFSPKKVLFGICGIGNGHMNRQLPVVKYLLGQGHQIMVFTYSEGLTFFKDHFPQHPNLTVIPVADPFFVGTAEGLDYEATALREENQTDFNKINCLAMHQASRDFGRPDLVISDYEMVAAQYAYAKRAPLVTLDQQSKYLIGDFAPNLNGTSYLDEVERLHLFFPLAAKRLAVSFFSVDEGLGSHDVEVEILPPMIRPEIMAAKGSDLSKNPSIVVYVTANQLRDIPVDAWIATIRSLLPKPFEAHIFLPKVLNLPADDAHLHFYHHGDERFDALFIAAHGVVSTAGHTLLSEAMYLEKPVYALPLPLYEQQLNAFVIHQGGFGLCEQGLSADGLRTFIHHLGAYSKNIREDKKYLIKEPGNLLILQKIDQLLEQNL